MNKNMEGRRTAAAWFCVAAQRFARAACVFLLRGESDLPISATGVAPTRLHWIWRTPRGRAESEQENKTAHLLRVAAGG